MIEVAAPGDANVVPLGVVVHHCGIEECGTCSRIKSKVEESLSQKECNVIRLLNNGPHEDEPTPIARLKLDLIFRSRTILFWLKVLESRGFIHASKHDP